MGNPALPLIYFKENLMSKLEKHSKDTAFMGDYDYVHIWIDELAWDGNLFNPSHRKHRHNKEGVEEVRKRWGDIAAIVAEIHIWRDEGKIPTREEITKQEGPDVWYDSKEFFG